MAKQIIMKYGTYSFKPVPLISIERQTNKVKNRDNPLGYTFILTLNGTLTPLPDDSPGLANTIDLTEGLRSAFDTDCKEFVIQCKDGDDDPIDLMKTRPRINTISFAESNNNWVETIPYTIQLEYDFDQLNEQPDNDVPPVIESYSEEWNFEFLQDSKYFVLDLSALDDQDPDSEYPDNDQNNPFEARVSRTINVVGKRACPDTSGDFTGIKSGVENAMNWLTGVHGPLNYNDTEWGHAVSGLTNLTSDTGEYTVYDHFRTHVINETDGSINLNENWLVVGNNSGLTDYKVREDFNVSMIRSADDGRTRLTIDGQIQGFEERDYSTAGALTPVSTYAYDNASDAWAIIQNRIFPRAQSVFQQEKALDSNLVSKLNPKPMNKTISNQFSKGIISYNYEFNDRPCNFISGALSENMTIIDNHPTDLFAKLTVLGRERGPVLQELTTISEASREVSIEAVMPLPTGCSTLAQLNQFHPSGAVEDLLCLFESQLTSGNDQVFKSADNESWNPLNGRYSRTVAWTYGNCSGSIIGTSFC